MQEWRAEVVQVILRLHLGKIDLVGIAPAASLFPNELQLHQLVKRSSHTLLADSRLPGQFLARKDDKTSPWSLIQPFLRES